MKRTRSFESRHRYSRPELVILFEFEPDVQTALTEVPTNHLKLVVSNQHVGREERRAN